MFCCAMYPEVGIPGENGDRCPSLGEARDVGSRGVSGPWGVCGEFVFVGEGTPTELAPGRVFESSEGRAAG